jgi:hypothetical protein
MRSRLKQWPVARPIRLLNLELRNRWRGLPDWSAVRGRARQRWREALARANGPKVLLATSVGSHITGNILDSVLAVALTLRGAEAHALLCDGALPACMACEKNWWPDHEHFVDHGPSRTLCGPCYRPARDMWAGLGVPLHLLGRHVTEADRDAAWKVARELPEAELDGFEQLGVRVGMHARSATLRYFASGSLENEPDAEPVRRRFLAAALMASMALDRLFREEGYDACVAHHGVYVPQGLLVDLARKHGARMVTWNIAYRAGSFIFSHDDTYHFTLMEEPSAAWETLVLEEPLETALATYMLGRATGAEDWISYQEGSGHSVTALSERHGIDFSKPTISAFTNVIWDAQVFYNSNAFAGMVEWLLETIRYFAGRPELQLVIRIHPAEVRNPMKSRQTAAAEIARAFPQLPRNIHVIPPEADANSYALARASNAAIIYGTKMGVELSYMGIPTIVAGESWARNKGFTLDADSGEAYWALLDKLPLAGRLDGETRRRAAKYAFHFFFRRTIPLDFLTVRKGAWPPFQAELRDIDVLLPGRSLGLDVICDGITRGTPFVFPAETLIGRGIPSHGAAKPARSPQPHEQDLQTAATGS